jgi:hypothetical protein
MKITNTVSGRANGVNYTFVTRTISRQEYQSLGDNIKSEPLAKRYRENLGIGDEHYEEE